MNVVRSDCQGGTGGLGFGHESDTEPELTQLARLPLRPHLPRGALIPGNVLRGVVVWLWLGLGAGFVTAPAAADIVAPTAAAESTLDHPLAGALLAGRAAQDDSDFPAQAYFYQRALLHDPANPLFLDAAMQGLVLMGDVQGALPLAQALLAQGAVGQIAALLVQADHFMRADHGALLASDAPATGPLTDALAPAWAQIGAGRMSEALEILDAMIAEDRFGPFALYQRALALALVGDFEGADDILSGAAGGPLAMGRRAILARLLVLGQLERFDEALELAADIFGTEPDADLIRTAFLETRALPFDLVTTAAEGMAEAYFVIASALAGAEGAQLPLIYAQLARQLDPRNHDASMLAARLLEGAGQYALAEAALATIPAGDPLYLSAQLARAQTLHAAGDAQTAIEQLRALAAQRGDEVSVHAALGDILRREERFEEAIAAYAQALALIETPDRRYWVLYFTKGVALERAGRFAQGEPWFRLALEFVPDNPTVLNYLGYSLVEERRNLDEALDMIERAVAGDPESGYIVDSLGWAFFRLGRYDEAVPVLERAVELLPNDPVINDHLGDAYWMVGREREARFQWRRALSLGPHADLDLDRVRRKLEVGLTVVLAEEDADPAAASALSGGGLGTGRGGGN